ncbi:Tubulin-specific chaperone cofactor E-like protein [Collichthys lucidus]|uniref:Tubulin-specific chaperone cofactor E-like protein n=1 Tax=Collichthys lucidus TaxID=240159 RepID=A0A4U5V1C7_COLLU|nr:Tubulin-specific chaperone cofactor E-like protein [Collichthys lucidus]
MNEHKHICQWTQKMNQATPDFFDRPSVQRQKKTVISDSGQIKEGVSSVEGEAVQQLGAMEPPEDMEGRTFVEVMSEKYSPENFPYRRGPGMGVVVVPTVVPQGSPMKGMLEISKIVSSIPNLEFLNLSSNPLAGMTLEPRCAEAFSRVRRLVLNNTQVSWDTVLQLTREIPELEELFLCLNEYSSVSASSVACPTLRLLHITDNSLKDWAEVRKFGFMFPSLDTLVMANNNLASIQDNKDILQRLFPNLRSMNLHNSGLNRWDDIEKLNFFPKLEEVRLQGIPLLQAYTNAERRSLMIAQLPSISLLNGSVVTDSEREDAERFFIRYYLDYPEEELPYRYHSLVTKYGKLEPLAEIDLRPRCHAQVEVHCEEKVEQLNIRLDQTVAELKKQLTTVVQLSTNSMRIYYINKCSAFGPEEMKYNTRALHSYSIQDGDEILVVPKTK